MNDCKYGFRCKNGVIDVNLIRSPSGGPGHNVDQGVHHIKLALLPHEGGLSRETYALAYQLNNPIYETAGDAASGPASCYASSNTNIVLESVQLSRDATARCCGFTTALRPRRPQRSPSPVIGTRGSPM